MNTAKTEHRVVEIEVGGAATHVEVWGLRGRGPTPEPSRPILLLHGNPDSGALWRPVVSRLYARTDPGAPTDTERPLRCLAPDLPGFARSGLPEEHDASLESMARWVDGVLAELGVAGAVDLVGHDFGGVYAGAWAVENPARVRSITLLDTFFHTDHRWHFWARVWRTPLLGELSMLAFRGPLFRREMRRGSPRLDDAHLRATWRFVTPEAKRAVLRLYRATDPEIFADWQEPLRRLLRDRPSLVVWGADDPYLPAERADAFGADRVVVLDDCGHWPPIEEPERVADELARLFAAS